MVETFKFSDGKIKKRIEEREGKIEGYRKGGDDLVASMPTKDLALQAILEAIWESQVNDVKIRAGVGKTRKEAGENAYLSDDVKFWHPSSTVVLILQMVLMLILFLQISLEL